MHAIATETRDLRAVRDRSANPTAKDEVRPALRLVAVGQLGGLVFFTRDGGVIGRSVSSDFLLADPGVSRRHLEVWHEGGEWLVRDLGSGNGSSQNGSPISGRQLLAHGDTLEIGNAVLRVELCTGDDALAASEDRTVAMGIAALPSITRRETEPPKRLSLVRPVEELPWAEPPRPAPEPSAAAQPPRRATFKQPPRGLGETLRSALRSSRGAVAMPSPWMAMIGVWLAVVVLSIGITLGP